MGTRPSRRAYLVGILLCLVVFLSVVGSYVMNAYDVNALLLVLIPLVSTLPVLVAFGKIPRKIYPLCVFVVSVSLLFHKSLISLHISGWDIHAEHYFASQTKMNSQWTVSLPDNYNGMLSIVMLAPILSLISGMSETWIFKVIYTLVYSLVPLILYRVYQEQMDDKTAFLSSFFFMSFYVFFSEMTQLARQEIAELFLVLLIFLIIDNRVGRTRRAVLQVMFAFSLVVSHYSLSYIFMLCAAAVWALDVLFANLHLAGLKTRFPLAYARSIDVERAADSKSDARFSRGHSKGRTISPLFVLMMITFALSWYSYVSSSYIINATMRIGAQIAGSIFVDFLNPRTTEGLRLVLAKGVSPLHDVHKILNLCSQILIVFGVVTLKRRNSPTALNPEYVSFSVASLALLVAGVVVPFLSSSINASRLYHIGLVFLAPFFVIGAARLFEILQNTRRNWSSEKTIRVTVKALSFYVAAQLLFSSGLVYELAKDNPSSVSLNSAIDYPRFSQKEVTAAIWSLGGSSSSPVYGDYYGYLLLQGFAFWRAKIFTSKSEQLPGDACVYFRTLNVEGEIVEFQQMQTATSGYRHVNKADSRFLSETIRDMNKIYDNGGAHVYCGVVFRQH